MLPWGTFGSRVPKEPQAFQRPLETKASEKKSPHQCLEKARDVLFLKGLDVTGPAA